MWRRLLDPATEPKPTHGAIMKLYQQQHARAHERRYGLVLLDEAHDLAGAQLGAVLALPGAGKVLAYDVHQSIYRFRNAIKPHVLCDLPCKHELRLTQTCGALASRSPRPSSASCARSAATNRSRSTRRPARTRRCAAPSDLRWKLPARRACGSRC